MKVDVVLITKNSATHTPVFEKCLRSVYREVPVERLIVVDDFSTDSTLKILEKFPRVEVHGSEAPILDRMISCEYTMASARKVNQWVTVHYWTNRLKN